MFVNSAIAANVRVTVGVWSDETELVLELGDEAPGSLAEGLVAPVTAVLRDGAESVI